MADSVLGSNGERLPLSLSAELRGKQSVRATFKLSLNAINALSVLALHLGIKQKSLFDHLMQDTRDLLALLQDRPTDPFAGVERVQKTFVISRRTLSSLREVCRMADTPRDVLVELSVQRLLPLIARERRRHRRRLAVMDRLGQYLNDGADLLHGCADQLGPEDPVYLEIEKMIQGNRQSFDRIRRLMAIGDQIETLEVDD